MSVIPGSVDMVVTDMSKTIAFYRMLGLDIPQGVEEQDQVEYASPNGFTLSWSLERMFVELGGPKWANLPSRGRMRLAFKCGSPDEVDTVYQKLIEAGYMSEAAPWDAFWGQRFAQVLDPDGALVDLYSPLALP